MNLPKSCPACGAELVYCEYPGDCQELAVVEAWFGHGLMRRLRVCETNAYLSRASEKVLDDLFKEKDMEEPIMKWDVGIFSANRNKREIVFCTDPVIMENFKKFGATNRWKGLLFTYSLIVDARYDFDEVQAYLAHYTVEIDEEKEDE